MFSIWIKLLLRFFDICGFCTEFQRRNSKWNRYCDFHIFLCHIFCAFTLTTFAIQFSMQPLVLNDVLPSTVNNVLQNTVGMFVYWTIIIESYSIRTIQKRFWRLYERVRTSRSNCNDLWLRNYSIKLIEYSVTVLPILLYHMFFFINFVGNFFFFRLGYLFSTAMYQYRVFYYLFYLEIIKYELKCIRFKLHIVSPDGIKCDSMTSNDLKFINQYYHWIHELSECINQIFGYSHFATILFCFLHPLR